MRIGIITSFPEPNVVKSAIAYYSQTILDPLRGRDDRFVIFADAGRDAPLGSCERYAENVTVLRCWRYGYFAPFQILKAALREPVDVLHLEYDVYLYGGVVAALLLPLVLRLLRGLRGTRIVTTLHGVVSQRVVTREMLRENGFVLPYSRIGRLGFYTIYGLFNWASNRIIVLEVKLAEILESEYGVPRTKLYVCPIPLMHEGPRPDVGDARRRCGIGEGAVALFFGYASYYKGLDVLLDALPVARERIPSLSLHIVAGRHPRLRGNPRYETFYEGLRAKAHAAGARMHGFVPETQLADLLAAADVVVLPYTATYGASAALNAVFAARKPVLVSTFASFDGALECQTFVPESEDCARAIAEFFEKNGRLLAGRVEEIARMRDVNVIAGLIQAVRVGKQGLDAAHTGDPLGAFSDAETDAVEIR
jgi:glycosyltransferase involved in cell wall biosynthesis